MQWQNVVDEVGAVMAIKCPRPFPGPLNGVQAIARGGFIDCSSPIFIAKQPSTF